MRYTVIICNYKHAITNIWYKLNKYDSIIFWPRGRHTSSCLMALAVCGCKVRLLPWSSHCGNGRCECSSRVQQSYIQQVLEERPRSHADIVHGNLGWHWLGWCSHTIARSLTCGCNSDAVLHRHYCLLEELLPASSNVFSIYPPTTILCVAYIDIMLMMSSCTSGPRNGGACCLWSFSMSRRCSFTFCSLKRIGDT